MILLTKYLYASVSGDVLLPWYIFSDSVYIHGMLREN